MILSKNPLFLSCGDFYDFFMKLIYSIINKLIFI